MATIAATTNTPIGEERSLNPLVTYDPQTMAVSNIRWSRVWQVAAIIVGIAFIALATTTFLYTTLYYPSQLVTASILILAVGMHTSTQAIKYLWDKKDAYASDAAVDKKLIQHMEKDLPKVSVQPGIDADKLKSVFARFSYFQEEKEKYLLECANLMSKESPMTKNVNFNDPVKTKEFKNAQIRLATANEFYKEAALCQLKSAFFLYLIKNPYLQNRSSTDYFEVVKASLHERLIAKAHGDTSTDILVKTKNKNYTTQDLLNKSPEKLMREVFERKTGWF